MRDTPKRNSYREVLSRLFLFAGTPPDTPAFALRDDDCVCREYEAGESVYNRLNFERSLGVVLTGELKAVKPGAEGRGVLMNRFSPGGVFGVAALFNAESAYVSEVLAVRRSRVLFLPQAALQRLFRHDPRTAENYIEYLSGRICFLNARIDNYTGGSAEARLAGILLTFAREQGAGLTLPLPLASLADMLNLGRASLYRAFDALEAAGALARKGRDINILDLDKLKEWR